MNRETQMERLWDKAEAERRWIEYDLLSCTRMPDALSDAIGKEISELRFAGSYDEAIQLGEERLNDLAGKKYDPIKLRTVVARTYMSKAERTKDIESREQLYDAAIKHLQAALSAEPNEQFAMETLADAYFLKGEYAKSLETYSNCASNNPDSAPIHMAV